MTERPAPYRTKRTASKFAARKDANHNDVVRALESAGYQWLDTYRQGGGAPDGFCLSKSAVWVALEIKSEGGEETKAERELREKFWPAPWFVVRSGEQAIRAMEAYDK